MMKRRTRTNPAARSPNEVRCLTDQKILISDEGGSEVDDLRVNGLPEGESPTGQEHAAEAGASSKTCRRWSRKTRMARRRPDCLNPNLQWPKGRLLDYHVHRGVAEITRIGSLPPNASARRTVLNESTEGERWGA